MGKISEFCSILFSGIESGNEKENRKIKVAIIGAGRVGVGLAEDLISMSSLPMCRDALLMSVRKRSDERSTESRYGQKMM